MASDGDFLIFEGNRYSRKGFLYKNFTMSAIIADGVYALVALVCKLLNKNTG